MNITFTCPACSQDLEAPPNLAGEAVSCPNCKTDVTVPGRSLNAAPPSLPKKPARDAPLDVVLRGGGG